MSTEAARSEKGIALLIVLWVITILMVVVLSFSYMTRTETYATLSFKELTEKKFLAEGGIERGIMELFYRRQYQSANPLEGNEVWKTDGTPYKVETDNGYSMVSITDESGKINLNNMTEVSGIILKNLLVNSGVREEDADTIVDSILDWKDKNTELHRLHGAGDDYYLSLPNPYKAKHDNFDCVEELLMVKGITSDILYGDGKKKGIIEFVTVAVTAGINLNAAPKEVLMAIPGIGPEDADAIISARGDQTGGSSVQAFMGKITAPFNALVNAGTGAGPYTVQAAGFKGTEKAGYGVRAIVSIDGNNKIKYIYFKSPVNLKYDRNDSN